MEFNNRINNNDKYTFLFYIFNAIIYSIYIIWNNIRNNISVRIKYRQFLSALLLMMIFSMFFAMFKFYWFTNKECITYGPYFLSIITDRISGGDGMDFTTKKTLKNKVNSFSMKVVNFKFFFYNF